MGVKRVEGKIAEVVVNQGTGDIQSLMIEGKSRVDGDFLLIVQALKSLLLGDALGVEFEDWGRWLASDSALAVQTESTEPPSPYTRAIAHPISYNGGFHCKAAPVMDLFTAADFAPMMRPEILC